MNKKTFLHICFFMAVLFSLVGCGPDHSRQAKSLQTEEIRIVSAGTDRARLVVELALTPKDQEYGLMGRPALASDTGMLFIFPDNRKVSFWMKNTGLPLDMIFIDQDGRINQIYEQAQPYDETGIPSSFQVRAVLEIAGGQAQKYGLSVGDLVLSPTLDHFVAEDDAQEDLK